MRTDFVFKNIVGSPVLSPLAHCKVSSGKLMTDEFFPDSNNKMDAQKIDALERSVAERICTGCPVQAACLEFAIQNQEQHGVWGGKTSKELRAIIRRRKRIKAA